MKILVTGATGNVGGHVVRALVRAGTARAGVRPRPATRPRGCSARTSNWPSGDLAAALAGTDRLFLACGNTEGQIEYECAVIDAAAAAGIARVVKLSGPDASADSPLIFERWHGAIEQHLDAFRPAGGAAAAPDLHDEPAGVRPYRRADRHDLRPGRHGRDLLRGPPRRGRGRRRVPDRRGPRRAGRTR